MTAYQPWEPSAPKWKTLYKIRRNLNTILLFLFVLNAIFLPADTFEVKKITLILLLVLNGDCYLSMRTKDEWLVFFFGFGLTSVTILLSAFWTGDLFTNIKIGYVGYIVALYPIIKRYRINFVKMTMHILTLLAYFIVIMGALDLMGIIPMEENPYLMWVYETDNAMIGKGSHLAIGYVIFMKASPMLFLGIAYSFLHPYSFLDPMSFSRVKYVNASVMCIALILSGTRANLLLCVVFALFCYVYQKKSRVKQILFILIMFVVVLFAFSDGALIRTVLNMFARKASSDAVRDATLTSILNVWKEDPKSFFLGSGFSAEFFNAGRNEFEYNVEISYWNLLRQVGLFLFLAMMVMYLYPAMRSLKERRNTLMVMGYVAYLIVAYTNPLLHSSTGMTTLLFMYCIGMDTIDLEKRTTQEVFEL